MTLARLKRIEALERRQSRGPAFRDPFDAIMRLWDDLQAVVAGRASWRSREPAEPWSEETKDAFELAMRAADRMHERLMAERGNQGT